MKRLYVTFIGTIILAAMLFWPVAAGAQGGQGQPLASAGDNPPVFPEGRDYATLVLRHGWDMDEYAEVSQGINLSGQSIYLDNIQVAGGVFSAASTSLNDAQYYQLWPGYKTAIPLGKVGHNYPIDASIYHCLYIAMSVPSQSDALQVYWFADENFNGPGGVWGASTTFALSSGIWKLYKIDLASDQAYWQGARWTARSNWQALRIDPTAQAGVNFAIDWVRLTDCSPVSNPISWSGGDGGGAVYVRRDGTDRDIQLEAAAQGFAYTMDLQGLAPGTYTYYVRNGGLTLGTGRFQVNAAPIVAFGQPGFSSEVDFATQAGNAWDFSGPEDVRTISGMSYQFVNGLLDLVTPSSNNPDPAILLNMPAELPNPQDYHFLSFRMYTEGAYQNIPHGFIIRWIWEIPGAQGSGINCSFVSQDIPFDVGWLTYTIDLNDAFNGHAEQVAGSCQGYSLDWQNDKPIVQLRFDPNENRSGAAMHQQIDWIRLTKSDSVGQGGIFSARALLQNKLSADLTSVRWYYATTPAGSKGALPAVSGRKQAALPAWYSQLQGSVTYLPVVGRSWVKKDAPPANGLDFDWDTSTVAPGTYYLCVEVSDGYNQATYCSEAPIVVTPP